MVVRWIRICRPVQGTAVLSLLWDDSTRCGAINPCQSYWARTLETTEHNHWACVPRMKRLWTALKSSRLAVIREGPNKDPVQANKKKKEWMNEFLKIKQEKRILIQD